MGFRDAFQCGKGFRRRKSVKSNGLGDFCTLDPPCVWSCTDNLEYRGAM